MSTIETTKFFAGQLVRVDSKHNDRSEMWPAPSSLDSYLHLPIGTVCKGKLCIVLDVYDRSCKVLVDNRTGWIDQFDLLPCEK